jgi:hypothetical protein
MANLDGNVKTGQVAAAPVLPVRIRREVRRILDAEARRLLREQVDADSVGTAPGADRDPLNGRAD